MSDYATILIYKWFFNLLEQYLMTYPVAKAVLLEMGFRLVLPHETNIRKPDLGVVLNDNSVPLLLADRSYQGTFDLCVEALSDSSKKEMERDTVKKKGEYAAAGVKEYYILYAHGEPMAFYRLNTRGVYVPIPPTQGHLIQSTVLPGFQFRIPDLLSQPTLEKLIEDPIYRQFVLPGYREAKMKAQREQRARQSAERQARQAQQAAQQAQQQRQLEQLAREQAEQQKQREQLAREQAEQRAQQAEQRIQAAEAEVAYLKSLLAHKDSP